jgi:uncharacterized protein YukE
MAGAATLLPDPMTPGPYPEGADAKIRQVANIFGRDDVIRLLDNIRNKLLGNSLAVQTMAFDFAKNNTLGEANATDIGGAVQMVSGTWTGRAADQFNAYAGRVGNALHDQQSAVATMSRTLIEISQHVISTYSQAIEFVGTCAAELAKLGTKLLVAIGTAEIPIVDLFTSKDVLDTVIDAFSTLINSVITLFADTVKTLGDYKGSSTALRQAETDFPEIPEMPGNSGMSNEKQWRVNPTAFPE